MGGVADLGHRLDFRWSFGGNHDRGNKGVNHSYQGLIGIPSTPGARLVAKSVNLFIYLFIYLVI